MATVTAIAAGAWTANAATVWSTGAVPEAGDAVALATFAVSMDMAATPALLSLTTAGAGQLTVDLTAGDFVINATTITGGSTTSPSGMIRITGAAPAATCTINATTINHPATSNAVSISHGSTGTLIVNATTVGGNAGASGAFGVENTSTGTVTITAAVNGASNAAYSSASGARNLSTGTLNVTGNCTGGAGTTSSAVHNTSTGSISITGNLIGGTGNGADGLANQKGTATLSSCNITSGTGSIGYSGRPPTWTPAVSNYIKWGTTYFATQKAATELKKGVVNGTITGTYDGGLFGATP